MVDIEKIDDGEDDLRELLQKCVEEEAKTQPTIAKKSKNVADLQEKTDEEIQLHKLIFGDKEGLIKNLSESVKRRKHPKEEVDEESAEPKKRKAVWSDADDETIKITDVRLPTNHSDHLSKFKTYKEYLVSQFNRVVSQPKWADLDYQNTDDSSDDEILRTVGFVAEKSSSALPVDILEYKKLKDLNRSTYSEGPITGIQFHPTSTAALVSGYSGIATIYSIDGLKNDKLHSMRFHDFPIKCTRILKCGTKAIFGSNKRFYFTYDLLTAQETKHTLPHNISLTQLNKFEISPCDKWMTVGGRFGDFHLFDTKSKELIHSFQQEHPVTRMKFTPDSLKVVTCCQGSDVNIFDVRQQRLLHSFFDDGCINGHCVDISSNSRMLATGSMEGVVNVYDFNKVYRTSEPKPEKTIMNLTTAIAEIQFNHNSEMLAMCSKEVPNALKLVHFPSGRVFSNFPLFRSEVLRFQVMEFSPQSGYLAVGSINNNIPLFRLKHYQNY